MRALRWYWGSHLKPRPADNEDVTSEGVVWAVIHASDVYGQIVDERRYGEQRFKTLDCAIKGVNPFEGGRVIGFSLVPIGDTKYRPGRGRLIFGGSGYTTKEWLQERNA